MYQSISVSMYLSRCLSVYLSLCHACMHNIYILNIFFIGKHALKRRRDGGGGRGQADESGVLEST